MNSGILIVDDEPKLLRSLQVLLDSVQQYRVFTANDYYAAVKILESETISIVVSDLNMPGKTGLDLANLISQKYDHIKVILMTAYSSVDTAIKAIKQGVVEYVEKPFDPEKILDLVQQLKPSHIQSSSHAGQSRLGDMVGSSPQMQLLYHHIEKAMNTDLTVLISGESGTGKELVAQSIHFGGLRKQKPFVAINCSAITESMLESELFGHERGAFTGAYKQREGKFELAHTGTLFLDEIGEMSFDLQAKLLRVLQEKKFERVGGSSLVSVDVRVIAATNRDLAHEIKMGRFREDLYFRLNVFPIRVPSLKERTGDLAELVDYFLGTKCRKHGVAKKRLSLAAEAELQEYGFPGNVRELENMIERAVVLCPEMEIAPEYLGITQTGISVNEVPQNDIAIEGGFKTVAQKMRYQERLLILRALTEHPNKSNAELAGLLGTTRRVLELRMKQYGIDPQSKNLQNSKKS